MAGGGGKFGSVIGPRSATNGVGGIILHPSKTAVSTPASAATPAKTIINEGVHLGDLSVTGSTYGAPRGIAFGTMRMGGNIIWSSGIREVRHSTVSKGKGTSKAKTVNITYTGAASFAVAFGEGPADHVVRIWADGKLIYNSGGGSGTVVAQNVSFKFYKGTPDQEVDPLILADKGAAQGVAFRNTVYIVFNNLDLEPFNNRVPQITAEISYEPPATNDRPQDTSEPLPDEVLTTYSSSTVAVDWNRNKAYYLSPATTGSLNGISRVDLNTKKKDAEFLFTDTLDQSTREARFSSLSPLGLMYDGAIVTNISTSITSNVAPIVRLDPSSLKETNRFGEEGAGTSSTSTRVNYGQFIFPVSTGHTIPVNYVVTASSVFNNVSVLKLPSLEYVWDSDTGLFGGLPSSNLLAACRGEPGWFQILNGRNYGVSHGLENVILTSFYVTGSAGYKAAFGSQGISKIVTEFTVADLIPGETSLDIAGPMVHDPVNKSLLIFVKGHTTGLRSIVSFGLLKRTITWRSEDIGLTPNEDTWYIARVEGNTFGQIQGDNGFMIDTTTGEVIFNQETPNWIIPEEGLGAGVYDSYSQSFVGFVSNPGEVPMIRFYFNGLTGQTPTTLDKIVSSLCLRTELTASDIDVTDLSSIEVPGYLVGKQTSIRAVLEPILSTYQIDVVESDDKLVFLRRGKAVARELTESNLGDVSAKIGSVVDETRIQEIELPIQFNLQYLDHKSDYQVSTHSVKRIADPLPTMKSINRIKFDINAALDADVAKSQAEKILYSAWVERDSFAFSFPWSQIDLDPTDVVNIKLNDGSEFRGRLQTINLGANFHVQTSMVPEYEQQGTVSVAGSTADIGSGVADIDNPVVTGQEGMKTFLLDTTLLVDNDDPTDQSGVPLYTFMGNYSENEFGTGFLYHNKRTYVTSVSLNSGWRDRVIVAVELDGVAWGSISNTLGDPPENNPFITDTVNSINVNMVSGSSSITSITEAQMFSGSNRAIIVKANGETEVIHFQTVVQETNGSYTLSTLLRGRRGTDTMSFGHKGGELFILSPIDGLGRMSIGSTAGINLVQPSEEERFTAVLDNAYSQQGENISLTPKYRALMPYAPTITSVTEDGSSNLDFVWERRTRVSGQWEDATGTVPLGESSEEYEIDIYTGSGRGDIVLRTITGITTDLYEYPNADIITDFGAVPSQISFELFQISSEVGRGFSRRTTIGLPNITVDPYWDSVVLLSSFEGVDAATSATDDSDSNHSFVFDNGVQLDTTQKKFGTSSVLMDGVDDNLYVVDHDDFDFGSSPFTVEGWFRWNTIQDSYNGLLGQWQAGVAEKWLLRWDTTGTLEFKIDAVSNPAILVASGSWTPTLNTWYHIAVDRDSSNNFRIYVDGVVKGTGTSTYSIFPSGSPQMSIGHYQGTAELDGWVDEVRITKGVARYAGAFTALTNRFPRPV